MGEKDIAEKTLESYNDVFADIVNVLIFGGKQVVKEKELSDVIPASDYKEDEGKNHSQTRDVAKYWKNGEIRLSMFGIENQTKQEKFMPIRIMSYDAASYRSQLLEKGNKQCYPIITLVLYFDTRHKWECNTSLKEVITIPPGLEDFINDYKIHVVNLAWLETEKVRMFKSGFREVVEYLQSKRKGEEFNGSKRKVAHIIELLNLLRLLCGTDKFALTEEQIKQLNDISGGKKMEMDLVMKKRFLDAEGRGMAKGKIEGYREAKAELLQFFSKLFSMGRGADVERATRDQEYLKKLMDEYQK